MLSGLISVANIFAFIPIGKISLSNMDKVYASSPVEQAELQTLSSFENFTDGLLSIILAILRCRSSK